MLSCLVSLLLGIAGVFVYHSEEAVQGILSMEESLLVNNGLMYGKCNWTTSYISCSREQK